MMLAVSAQTKNLPRTRTWVVPQLQRTAEAVTKTTTKKRTTKTNMKRVKIKTILLLRKLVQMQIVGAEEEKKQESDVVDSLTTAEAEEHQLVRQSRRKNKGTRRCPAR